MTAREKLIQAAEKCLLEKGSHASNVKAIALEAGVNHGLVHHYFGSKEGLFIELLKSLCKSITPQNKMAFSPEEVKSNLLKCLLSHSAIMNEFRTMALYMPELNKELCSMVRILCKNIETSFGIDSDNALLVVSVASGLCLQSRVYENLDTEKLINKMYKLLEIEKDYFILS